MTKLQSREPLRKQDYQALAGFRHALREFLAFSEQAAGRQGVTPVQHQALLAIKGMPHSGPVSIGDLAGWLGVRHHSAVGLVDRLASHGLVHKRADAADRRRIVLTLTAKADRKLAALTAAHRGELRRLSGALGSLIDTLR
jgi:DNA-binding MarR family transcriptional regulator